MRQLQGKRQIQRISEMLESRITYVTVPVDSVEPNPILDTTCLQHDVWWFYSWKSIQYFLTKSITMLKKAPSCNVKENERKNPGSVSLFRVALKVNGDCSGPCPGLCVFLHTNQQMDTSQILISLAEVKNKKSLTDYRQQCSCGQRVSSGLLGISHT